MPEFRSAHDEYHNERDIIERLAPYEEETRPTPPDGMSREEWLQALGYSAPRPLPVDKEPSSKDRIHKKQLRNWRGWKEN